MRIELISLVSQTNTLPLSYSRQTRVGIEPTLLYLQYNTLPLCYLVNINIISLVGLEPTTIPS